MSVHQTKKSSDLEKRLRILSQQLYGKNNKLSAISYQSSDKKELFLKHEGSDDRRLTTDSSISDISYLRADLTKTLILSSLAIGVQLFLFFGSRTHLLRIF